MASASEARRAPGTRGLATIVIGAISTLAGGVWLGGWAVLGAVVAPIVFRTVPAPASADAMTLVFRRFDRIAIACAVVVLLAEVARAVLRLGLARVDVARAAAAAVGAAAAVYQALAISPHIEALHRAGAIRGAGEDGLALEAAHRVAEACGKLQVGCAFLVVVLAVVALGARGQSSRAAVSARTP